MLLVVSCSSRDNESESPVSRAEELMAERPDSALHILNGMGNTWETFRKKGRMRYLLLRTEALNKTYAALDTIEYMGEVLDYYKRRGSAAERTRSYYMMGSVYRDRGNSPQALIYFRDAVNQTSERDKDRDYALLSRIYVQMALLFNQQRYAQQEAPAWGMAYKYAMLAKDTLMALQTIEGQGYAYWTLDEKDSAMLTAQKVIEEYKKIGKGNYAAAAMAIPMHYYLERDSLPQAKRAIDEYISNSGLVDENLAPSTRNEMFYFNLGQYYEKTGRSDSAIYFYRRLLEYDDDIQNIENGYLGLMSVYQKNCEADSVFKYAKLYAAANDSANRLNSAGEISRTQALYNLNESQRIAMNKTIEAARLRGLNHLMAIASVVIVVAICYYVRHRLKEEKEKRLRINKEYSDSLIAYVRAQEELVSLHTNTAYLIEQKEREIDRLKKVLLSYPEDSNLEKWDYEQWLLTSKIVQRMHHYAVTAKSPSGSEWKDLIEAVKASMPEFYTFIYAPQKALTDKERQVCILTRLNFIPNEISILLGLSSQRVTNLRTKINQKLFNERGATSLNTNIRHL